MTQERCVWAKEKRSNWFWTARSTACPSDFIRRCREAWPDCPSACANCRGRLCRDGEQCHACKRTVSVSFSLASRQRRLNSTVADATRKHSTTIPWVDGV